MNVKSRYVNVKKVNLVSVSSVGGSQQWLLIHAVHSHTHTHTHTHTDSLGRLHIATDYPTESDPTIANCCCIFYQSLSWECSSWLSAQLSHRSSKIKPPPQRRCYWTAIASQIELEYVQSVEMHIHAAVLRRNRNPDSWPFEPKINKL